jgi:hypothetical protein
MRKMFAMALFSAALLALIPGCKGKDKAALDGDPKTVVAAFFERMSKKDIDGAAKLCTKESKSTLDLMKKAVEAAEKMKGIVKDGKEDDGTEDFKYMQIGEGKINGDNATVAVTNSKKNETIEFPLKKEDGRWKVDFTMSTLMKLDKDASTNPTDDDTNNSIDTSGLKDLNKLLNSDTLKKAMEQAKDILEKVKPEDVEKMKELLKEQQ